MEATGSSRIRSIRPTRSLRSVIEPSIGLRIRRRFGCLCRGFFLWDCYIVVRNNDGFAFAFHAIMCLVLNLSVMRPIFQYYGMIFMFYEVSTLFLNVHWFCDKMDLTGSVFQLVNGVILLTTFFSIRLVYGSYHIYQFFSNY